MFLLEGLNERQGIVPKPGDTLVERVTHLTLRLRNRLPVICRRPAFRVPVHDLHTERGLENEPVQRLNLRIDITQEVITLGNTGVLLHLTDRVRDVAYVHRQAFRSRPRAVFVLNRLRR